MNPTNHWQSKPFVRIFLFTSAGIWSAEIINNHLIFDISKWFICAWAILGNFVRFRNISTRRVFKFIGGLCISMSIFIVATHFSDYNSGRSGEIHYTHYWSDQTKGIVEIVKLTRSSERWVFFEANTRRVIHGDSIQPVHGRIQLSIKKTNHLPGVGDVLMINNTPIKIKHPPNPGMFNYSAYMSSLGISHSIWLRSDQYVLVGKTQINGFQKFQTKVSYWVDDILSEHIRSDQNKGILKALILGDKSEIQSDTKSTFSETGTIHVLAISGLHVGILYLLISSVLSRLIPGESVKFLRFVLLVVALLTYALLTGLQPSVFRASLMFCMLELSKVINRKGISINTLCLVGFVILVFNPNFIQRIGFQFSFLAVAGILTWHHRLKSLFPSKSFFLNKMADLALLSIIAQLTLMPLSIYYFHQFPMYFLLANLVVVPCISVIMIIIVALLIFYWVPILAEVLSFILESYLWFILRFSELVRNLPGNLEVNLWWDWKYAVVVGLIICFIFFMIGYQIRKLRIAILGLLIVQVGWLCVDKYGTIRQKFLATYVVRNDSIPVLIQGKRGVVVSIDSMTDVEVSRQIEPGLRQKGVEEIRVVYPNIKSEVLSGIEIEREELQTQKDEMQEQFKVEIRLDSLKGKYQYR